MCKAVNPQKGVLAIRIYFGDNGYTPMADLLMVDHTIETIEWVNVEQRQKYADAINGYTLMFDERSGTSWNDLVGEGTTSSPDSGNTAQPKSAKEGIKFKMYVLRCLEGEDQEAWHNKPYKEQRKEYEDAYMALWANRDKLPDEVMLPDEFEFDAWEELFLALEWGCPEVVTNARRVKSLDDLVQRKGIRYFSDREGNKIQAWLGGTVPLDEAIALTDDATDLLKDYWVRWLCPGNPATTFVVNIDGVNGIMLSFLFGYPEALREAKDKLPIDRGYDILEAKAYQTARWLLENAPADVDIYLGKNTRQDMVEVSVYVPRTKCWSVLGFDCSKAAPGVNKVLWKLVDIKKEMEQLLD